MKKLYVTILAAFMFLLTINCKSNDISPLTVEKINLANAKDSPKWVASLKEAKDAEQLFIVAAVDKTTAYISMHQKDINGKWKQIMSTPGFIGENGLNKTEEGDLKTPTGTYSFNYAFGIADNPGCAFDYHKVGEDDYWSGDQRKGYKYNQMVSVKDYPDLDLKSSEHIIDYVYQYQYGLNISWNEKGIPRKGSAIFLHCFGDEKPYTSGCVAIPKNQMITVMQNVRKDCIVKIDSLKNISPETWKEWKGIPEL